MSTSDDIRSQHERLQIQRQSLATYLKQLALQGEAFVLPFVAHGIREARGEIARIKATLRGWGEVVADHPDDSEAPVETPPQRAAGSGGGSQINFGSGNTFGDLNFGAIAGGNVSNQMINIGGPAITAPNPGGAAPAQPQAGAQQRQIFLCHAEADKPAVRELYARLRADGHAPWLDEEDLLPGHAREPEIRKAVRASAAVVVCLSRTAAAQAGFQHREIRLALDVADEQPEGRIFLIPVRLEPCDLPERLAHLQPVNLYEEGGYERLRRALPK